MSNGRTCVQDTIRIGTGSVCVDVLNSDECISASFEPRESAGPGRRIGAGGLQEQEANPPGSYTDDLPIDLVGDVFPLDEEKKSKSDWVPYDGSALYGGPVVAERRKMVEPGFARCVAGVSKR